MKKQTQSQKSLPIKIAYLGGGSRGWAHILMNDLAQTPLITGEVALYDLNKDMARLNVQWGNRVNASPQAKSQWKYTVPQTLKEALTGAHFVMASIQPGPIEYMGHDLDIPKKYGIIHPVGDTVGPAGLVRSLRAVQDYRIFAQAIERYCPNAWVINLTNPMTVLTRTLYKVFPQVKAFGCCHEVFSSQKFLAEILKEFTGIEVPYQQINLNVLGINHFTWIDRAFYKDIDLFKLLDKKLAQKGTIREITPDESANVGYFANFKQVTYDLYRRYGILPAGGDRHLVEFVPFYAKNEEELLRWGVKVTPYSYRKERYETAPNKFRERLRDKKTFELTKSSEEGVTEILAILGLGDFHSNINLPNIGQVEGLPRDTIVETNAWFTYDSVKPEYAGRLPRAVESLVSRAASNQEIIIDAALTKDKHLAFQAFLNDPLMSLPPDRAWQLFNEMLAATKPF